jgi:16S rRNA (guanine(1405)-N(7))-methyltransferase
MAETLPSADPALDSVTESVRQSRRYGGLHEPLVRREAARALEIERGNVRSAAKRTKRQLHQIFGAYLPHKPRYDKLLGPLEEAVAAGDSDRVREALRSAMALHSSTRERLSILDEMYSTIFERLGPVDSLLDAACGLNPLAAPWMGLPEGCRYLGFDIDATMIEFVGRCLELLRVDASLWVGDLLHDASALGATVQNLVPKVDVALLLKSVPCLAQQRADAWRTSVDALPARRVVVSFPTQSIGGRSKGMRENYTARFEELAAETGWEIERFVFSTEIVFLVDKGSDPSAG